MNAHTRITPVSLFDDTVEHARKVYADLLALEALVGVEPCKPLHHSMWKTLKRQARHLGTTPEAILGVDPVVLRSGGDDKDLPG